MRITLENGAAQGPRGGLYVRMSYATMSLTLGDYEVFAVGKCRKVCLWVCQD